MVNRRLVHLAFCVAHDDRAGHCLSAAQAIATALGANDHSRLQGLYLQSTHAGERAGRALLQMLEHNTSLTKLHLHGNHDIDADTRQNLRRVCEGRRTPIRLSID